MSILNVALLSFALTVALMSFCSPCEVNGLEASHRPRLMVAATTCSRAAVGAGEPNPLDGHLLTCKAQSPLACGF